MALKTLSDFVTELKAEYPTLTKGVNNEVIDLTESEYQTTITAWAEDRLAKQSEAAVLQKAALEKAAILAKLGITADELKIALG